MSLLTEEDVRKLFADGKIKEKTPFSISRKQVVTPSAREFLTEKNISIQTKEEAQSNQEKEQYTTLFGATLTEKPEHMTHLRGNVLVRKDNRRIALRGAIDSLESEVILVQVLAQKQGKESVVQTLEEVIAFLRRLMRAEITGESIEGFCLCGLGEKEIRDQSHHPSKYFGIKHFLPSMKQGELVAHLNYLRTRARRVELIAYDAFKREEGALEREDIIQALNRLSSFFWIMMFQCLKGG